MDPKIVYVESSGLKQPGGKWIVSNAMVDCEFVKLAERTTSIANITDWRPCRYSMLATLCSGHMLIMIDKSKSFSQAISLQNEQL